MGVPGPLVCLRRSRGNSQNRLFCARNGHRNENPIRGRGDTTRQNRARTKLSRETERDGRIMAGSRQEAREVKQAASAASDSMRERQQHARQAVARRGRARAQGATRRGEGERVRKLCETRRKRDARVKIEVSR